MRTATSIVLSVALANLTEVMAGPISPYYLAPKSGGVVVVQGHLITNSFATVNVDGGSVYVHGDRVATADSRGVSGGFYSLDGTPTGETFTNPDPGPQLLEDVASDGTTVFGFAFFVQDIFSHNLDYSNRQTLKHYPQAGFPYSGIAYDTIDQTLWLGGWNVSELTQVDLFGNVLRTFPIATDKTVALAIDPADQTLWFVEWQTENMYQYSKDGQLLDFVTIEGMPTDITGGDFAIIPESATLTLATLATCAWIMRRRW